MKAATKVVSSSTRDGADPGAEPMPETLSQ